MIWKIYTSYEKSGVPNLFMQQFALENITIQVVYLYDIRIMSNQEEASRLGLLLTKKL